MTTSSANEIRDSASLVDYAKSLDCIHCGLCSEACHYYLSHEKDPHYSPVGKVKQTLWEMIRKKGRVSPEFIKQAAVIAQTECNLCKRCAQYCPFGIAIAYIMSVVRRIVHRLGVTPRNITKLVDGLESEGLVRREADPGDRRATIVGLTPDGETVTKESMLRNAATLELFAELSDRDRADFLRVLERLLEALDERSA